MNWFPQIGAGSVAQFPVTRSRKWRAITNSLESGEMIMLPDTTAGQIQWKLSYRELQDIEVQSLTGLFMATQGEFGAFTFIDPLANLLGWSESLTQSAWQAGLLSSSAGVTDPLGTARASSITNSSAGVQSLQQTLGLAGSYVTCFSAYMRSDLAGTVALQRDNTQVQFAESGLETGLCERCRGYGGGAVDFFGRAIAGPDDRRLGFAGGSAALPVRLQADFGGFGNLRGNIFRRRRIEDHRHKPGAVVMRDQSGVTGLKRD
jgi:hypothetical protein